LGNQNADFWRRNNKLAQNKQISSHRGDFFAPQVSINCLACPKEAKNNQISNEQAVY
jgi:hypothetical protein